MQSFNLERSWSQLVFQIDLTFNYFFYYFSYPWNFDTLSEPMSVSSAISVDCHPKVKCTYIRPVIFQFVRVHNHANNLNVLTRNIESEIHTDSCLLALSLELYVCAFGS